MKRMLQLDGVRTVAILAVLLHHTLKAKLMWMGVDVFFVLSGFLITGILLNAKGQPLGEYFSHFYARRVRRIVAPYLLTLAMVTVFLGAWWAHYWYWYLGLTNFLIPLHIPHPGAFDPLWSLAVEEQFYLVWPFAVYFLSEKHLQKFAIFLVILAPVLRGIFHFKEYFPIHTMTFFRMDLLASGALLCLAYRNHKPVIEKWGFRVGALATVFGLGGLLAFGLAGVSTYSNNRMGNVLKYECALIASVGIMLWALSGSRVALLKWAPVAYIGRISYTIYLIHMLVLTLIGSRLSPIPAALAMFVITVAYASASWFLMEKPLLGSSHKKKLPVTAAAETSVS